MRAVQPSTHAAQAFFMPMGEKVIGRLRPVPRTVPVRSIGFLSAPLEPGVECAARVSFVLLHHT